MIKDLKAREILDSRGNPTVEVSLFTDKGEFISSVPSGASTGRYEAKEFRDGGERYMGKGVLEAVENVNKKIAPLIIGKKVGPLEIDKIMIDADGTEDKSNLGANAILGVSMCVFRAGAMEEGVPLFRYFSRQFNMKENIPKPCFNVINGGVHGKGGVSFQEFMIVPQKKSFSENLRYATEFYHRLRDKILESAEYNMNSVNIGDEGGFVPEAQSAEEVLSLIASVDSDCPLIIDVAASEFFKEGGYVLEGERVNKEDMIVLYKKLSGMFPIIGIEDPLEEDDFTGWYELKKELNELLVIGDDLLTTNIRRMEKAKEIDSCNAMILKMNQIGSVSEAVEAVKRAKDFGWKVVASHRSGETNDDFVADFAVGIGADYIKSGAPVRGERVAKYNKILKIEAGHFNIRY